MATPVVENVQTATSTSSGKSVTVTKPTGLAEDDLLWLYTMAYSGTDEVSLTTPSGWTASHSYTNLTDKKAYSFWKIADSSDVAASDFTFTWTSDESNIDEINATLMRVSNVSTAGPIRDSGSGTAAPNQSTPDFTVNVDPLVSDALYIVMYFGEDDSSVTSYEFDTTSPTFTQVANFSNAGDYRGTLAWANAVDESVITTLTVNLDNNNPNNFGALVALSEQKSASATSTTLELAPTLFTGAGSSGSTGTSTTLDLAPTTFTGETYSGEKVWTTTPKS